MNNSKYILGSLLMVCDRAINPIVLSNVALSFEVLLLFSWPVTSTHTPDPVDLQTKQ
jgi:hypothetical protein